LSDGDSILDEDLRYLVASNVGNTLRKKRSICAVQAFAQDGLRTLCLAVKKIDAATFEEWRQKHHEARSVDRHHHLHIMLYL